MEFKNNKISFSKRAIAILMFFVFVAQSFVLNSSAISVFGATDPIELKWATGGDLIGSGYNFTTNNTGYDAYFSDTRTMSLGVQLTQPTQAGDTVEIVVEEFLNVSAVSVDTPLNFLTSAPVWNKATRTITANLKTGITGSFNIDIGMNFNDKVSIHNETAKLIATSKNNGTVMGTPVVKTMKLYNDSKIDIRYDTSPANGDITPGAWVNYNFYAANITQLYPGSGYAFSYKYGINAAGKVEFPLPAGAETAEMKTGSGSYDSTNKVVTINFTPSTITWNNSADSSATFRVKYDSALTPANGTIAGATPIVTAKTFSPHENQVNYNNRYDVATSNLLLTSPVVPIKGKVVAAVPVKIDLSTYGNATRTFYPGTDFNKYLLAGDQGKRLRN